MYICHWTFAVLIESLNQNFVLGKGPLVSFSLSVFFLPFLYLCLSIFLYFFMFSTFLFQLLNNALTITQRIGLCFGHWTLAILIESLDQNLVLGIRPEAP